MCFIVPAHLQGENNGFSASFSSAKHILHRGIPELPWEASLTTKGGLVDSFLFGTIMFLANFLGLLFSAK